jgi:hypothetical protein
MFIGVICSVDEYIGSFHILWNENMLHVFSGEKFSSFTQEFITTKFSSPGPRHLEQKTRSQITIHQIPEESQPSASRSYHPA